MGLGKNILSPFRQTTGLGRWILLSGLVLVGLFTIVAIFAPWIAPYDYAQVRADGEMFPKNGPPSSEHWLGTTEGFYDVYSRIIWGSRTALEVVIIAVVVAVLIGAPLGLVSGYLGGWLDRVTVLIMDTLYTIPSLLLAIVFSFLLTGLLGGGVTAAGLALTVVYVPQYFRVVRNTTLSAREATYVEAARAIGAPKRTIMTKYLFGNVIQNVPVIGTLNAADAISTLAALGFLGLGIQPGQAAEWGYDLQRALPGASAGIWWTGVFPGLAIVLLVTGLTLVGEGLNETINPTLRKRRLRPFKLPPREQVPATAQRGEEA
jgi:peptide/nickel transport system permease protein